MKGPLGVERSGSSGCAGPSALAQGPEFSSLTWEQRSPLLRLVLPLRFTSAGFKRGRCRPRVAVQPVPFVPAGAAVQLQSLKVFKRTATDGPTPLWGLSSAASPRRKSWVWMARGGAAAAAGSKGSVGPRTGATRPLKEAPHHRGTEEEADQTREADWEGKEK